MPHELWLLRRLREVGRRHVTVRYSNRMEPWQSATRGHTDCTGGGGSMLGRRAKIWSRLIVTVSAVITVVAGVALHLWGGVDNPAAVAVSGGSIAALVLVLNLLDRLVEPRGPSNDTMAATGMLLRDAYATWLDMSGARQDDILPPIALRAYRESAHQFDLEEILTTAETVETSSFIARVAESPRLTMVFGQPGAGKTALLLRLALQMMDDYLHGPARKVPIFLWLRDWADDGSSLRSWALRQTAATYSIRPTVVQTWLDRGDAVFLLDGLNEVSEDRRDHLVDALNAFALAPQGTQVVVSCRTSDTGIAMVTRWLQAEQLAMLAPQVAVLRPLPESEARQYLLRRAFRHDTLSSSSMHRPLQPTLRRLVEELIEQEADLRAPALLGLIEKTVAEYSKHLQVRASETEEGADSAELVFRLGNQCLARGDYRAAIDAYGAVLAVSGSHLKAPAAVLRGATKALLGDHQAAHDALIESVALRLKESIEMAEVRHRTAPLSEDERLVLNVLSDDISYDPSQISALARLTPDPTNLALRALRDAGLVEVIEEREGRPRFRRNSAFAAAG